MMVNEQTNSNNCERQRTAPIMNVSKRAALSTDPCKPATTYLLPIIEGKPVKSAKSRTSHVTTTKQLSAIVVLGSQPLTAQKHRQTLTIEPLPLMNVQKSKHQRTKNNSTTTKFAKPNKEKTGKRSTTLKKLLKATSKNIPKIKIKSIKIENASVVTTETKPSVPSLFITSTKRAPNSVKHQNRSLRIRSKSIVSTDTDTDDNMGYDEPSTFFQRPCPCVCGRHNGDDFVGCNGGRCERKWFHIACMGLRHDDVNSLRGWLCPKCD